MTPVRLEPAALRSRVKHSTTEPLRSQAYPELQIASVQAQIMGTFSPNMDRVENKDVMNTGVFLLVWYIFTRNM